MIHTAHGRVICFHESSVLDDDFSHLDVGSEIRFVEARDDKGPQASTVKLVGKHHITGP